MSCFTPKGYVIVDKELKFTREPGAGPDGEDLTKPYFDALKLKMVVVMDVAVDGSDYIVLGDSPEVGQFMWFVDKRDTISKLIPYSLLHPNEPSLEDLIGVIGRLVKKEPLTDEDFDLFSSLYKKMTGKDLLNSSG